MINLGDLVIYAASVITAMTTIGAALLWFYKRLVLDPAKRMDKELQEKSSRELKETIEPLSRSIEMLNKNLEDSVQDRKQLNERVDEHGKKLVDHDKRLTVLEVRK